MKNYISDGKLQEQVERFRRDINRLEYQNDQVSKVSDAFWI